VALIELAPPLDPEPLRQAVAALEGYRWVVFTSGNAVEALAAAAEEAGRAWPVGVRIASVGPSTSRAVRERLHADAGVEPARDYRAEGLLAALAPVAIDGQRVLLPVSDRARDAIAVGLRARGARVDVVEAYRTVTPPGAAEAIERALAGSTDLVTLASPSAVESLSGVLGPRTEGLPAAVIGPLTERAARAAGLDVRVVAEPSTAEGLVEAIRRRFAP
jgi:uroporphyrinogen-III synthase